MTTGQSTIRTIGEAEDDRRKSPQTVLEQSKMGKSRSYHRSLDFVESGFRACWRNANDLISASQKLMNAGLHAPALSLAVLALEEVGKLCLIDGLLFAAQGDDKSALFGRSDRSHSDKLLVLETLRGFLSNFSRSDPRYGTDQNYMQAVAISLRNLQDDGNAVLALFPKDAFLGLDKAKQRGFYAADTGRAVAAPSQAVDPLHAKTIRKFAWRAISTLDFVLMDGNLERYLATARSVRSKLTDEQHRELEQLGEKAFANLFPDEASPDDIH